MAKSLNPRLGMLGDLAWKAGLGCLALIILLLVVSASAQAESKTWDGGCGVDTTWSCANNWSDNVVPGAEDTVTFSAVSTHNSVVDPGFAGAVATVNINTGYTGTITLARPLAVSTTFTQKVGSFDAGDQALTLKALSLSGGAFKASSGTTSVAGAFKVTGTPSFDANGGTVDFVGGSGTLTCGGVVFNRVILSHSIGTKTVGSGCALPLGNDPSAGSGGSIKLNGTLSGTGTLTTSGTLTLGATGSLPGFSGLATTAMTVNGVYDFGAYSTFAVATTFALSPGASFVAPSATASFGGKFTISAEASFKANGGVVVFDGTASSALSCGSKAFNLVKFEHTTGRKTVGVDCSLPLGNDPTLGEPGSASVTLNGSLSGTGTMTAQQTFIMNSTSSLSGFSGLITQSGLTISGASANFGSYGTFAVNGNYAQTGGTVTAPAGANFDGQFSLKTGSTFNAPATGLVYFGNNFTVGSGAIFNANGSTVDFDGGHSGTITCGGTTFNLVAFSNVGGTKIVGTGCSLPLGNSPSAGSGGSITLNGALSGSGALTTSGTLTLATSGELSGFSGLNAAALTVSGTHGFGSYSPFTVDDAFTLASGAHFTAPSGEAFFGGNFTSEAASTFTANGGTAVLDGTAQTIAGSTTFNNLSKRVSSADTLTFRAGDTQTVQGTLALEGKDAGNLLTLASTAPGTPWLIDRKGTSEVRFVSASDSTNVGTTITANESTNGGGNTGWIFPGPATELVLAAATTTPKAGEADNLTITAKDAQGNTATTYTGPHNLTFGPVADSPSGAHATVTNSSGTATNFGSSTAIGFTEGIATVSSGKNGAMVLVKAGATSIAVTDGSIANGSGLAVAVGPGVAARLAWTSATASKGTLSSPCLFSCTGTGLTSSGTFKANVSVTDSSGNTVSALGSGHTVSVTADSGTVTGGALTIASTGPAASTTQFTFTPPSKGAASTLTAATAAGTVYTSATALIAR
ncbi:MAG TPA: hypothetical protein VMS60_04000 [Solirubrobacterales bacterium]|nr:hypothetical protein [Solirubrobacterales bacterium]